MKTPAIAFLVCVRRLARNVYAIDFCPTLSLLFPLLYSSAAFFSTITSLVERDWLSLAFSLFPKGCLKAPSPPAFFASSKVVEDRRLSSRSPFQHGSSRRRRQFIPFQLKYNVLLLRSKVKMFRGCSFLLLSIRQFANNTTTRSVKQRHRGTKAAALVSQRRAGVQRQNFEFQQHLNQQFGAQQKYLAVRRQEMRRAAEDLMQGGARKRAQRTGDASHVHHSAQSRAAELATARQILGMNEATRREMKRGRGARTEVFRSHKRWS